MRRAVFLDRDGTLVREVNYLSRLEDLEVLPGVAEALCTLGNAGFLRILVTNQSGIARGYFDRAFVDRCHLELQKRLQLGGADLEAVYVCPHHPDFGPACRCRKPEPGMIERAVAEWPVDLEHSWVIGDKPADILLGRRVGCRTGLVLTGYGSETRERLFALDIQPDVTGSTLTQVAEEIVRE